MKKIGLIVDSTFNMDEAYVKAHQIEVVSLSVLVDDNVYLDGLSITNEQLLGFMESNHKVMTSQPTPESFVKAIETQFAKGFDQVLVLTISSGLSGTLNSANLALQSLDETAKDVRVVDSRQCAFGSEYIAEKAIELIESGIELDQLKAKLEKIASEVSLWFTVDNLNALVKSGRLSKVQAVIGNALKIKPILKFSNNKLDLDHKVRSAQKVFEYMAEEVAKLAEKGKVIIRISHVSTPEKAVALKDYIMEKVNNVSIKLVKPITTVVSVHIGRGGMGMAVAYE